MADGDGERDDDDDDDDVHLINIADRQAATRLVSAVQLGLFITVLSASPRPRLSMSI